jgi:hypothetical protein
LPFELKEYEKDFSPSELMILQDLLAQNKHQYEVVNPLKDNSPETRNEAYLATGKHLVDECDILLAVWDGQPAKGKGGTGDIVEYAHMQGKELHIVNVHGEEELYKKYDLDAIADKDTFTKVWAWGLRLAVLAVVFFAIGLNFSKNHIPKGYPYHLSHLSVFILALLEIICLFTSAYLLIVWARKLKNSFLKSRRNAEVLRSINLYKQAGIPLPQIDNNAYMYADEVLQLEADATQNPITLTNIHDAKRKVCFLAEDQIKYHTQSRIPRLKNYEDKLRFWFKTLKIIFFTTVILKFLIELQEFLCLHFSIPTHFALPFFNCIVIIVPSVYAALEGVSYFSEYKKNIAVSNEIVEELVKCKSKMNPNITESEFLDETIRLRKILELENSEWVKRLFDFHFGPQI